MPRATPELLSAIPARIPQNAYSLRWIQPFGLRVTGADEVRADPQ
jgi:hypothetical protein